jgi:hypothetical protein
LLHLYLYLHLCILQQHLSFNNSNDKVLSFKLLVAVVDSSLGDAAPASRSTTTEWIALQRTTDNITAFVPLVAIDYR